MTNANSMIAVTIADVGRELPPLPSRNPVDSLGRGKLVGQGIWSSRNKFTIEPDWKSTDSTWLVSVSSAGYSSTAALSRTSSGTLLTSVNRHLTRSMVCCVTALFVRFLRSISQFNVQSQINAFSEEDSSEYGIAFDKKHYFTHHSKTNCCPPAENYRKYPRTSHGPTTWAGSQINSTIWWRADWWTLSSLDASDDSAAGLVSANYWVHRMPARRWSKNIVNGYCILLSWKVQYCNFGLPQFCSYPDTVPPNSKAH